MERVKMVVQGLLTLVAALWNSIPELTQLLVALMAIDVLMGTIIAVRDRNLSVMLAWKGALKKVGVLLLVGVAGLLSPHVRSVIDVDLVQASSAFYIVPELTSILRNAAILDIPVFSGFRDVLAYFNRASGGKKVEE